MPELQQADVVRRAYEHFKTGNIEALLSQMTDEVIWRQPEVANAPLYKERAGKASVAEFFSELAATEEVLKFEPREFIAEGDRVTALGSYHFRVRATGGEYETDFAHVFTIRDQKIAAFQEFMDTAAVSRAFAKSASGRA